MRIFDDNNDRPLNSVLLLLTIAETKDLIGNLQDSIQRINQEGYHFHIDDNEFKHQITGVIYTDDNKNSMSVRLQRLIAENT